ncbi:ferredoxin related protein [Acidilobus saccharovorans 345-15]|uniref:Ferredoxin related protein n=1 Tax=Acidilobus saccharovorans (strain DSM 16705 / JCM 18335 / VKM B-2471 / 345-15) TaxID=666510 RepID=D9Q1Y1_ACIS3|nr:Rieske (2Fe-2S) protein [Acidilobus saccharovorans]ADL19319.1 ferredoxin related protein [Acidilobus saccharovorans 345-15]
MVFRKISVMAKIFDARDHAVVIIDNTPVLIVKHNGEFYAMDARCPHMGCGVLSDVEDGHIAVCPLHKAKFDVLTGDMVSQPIVMPERKCEFNKELQPPLKTYRVRVSPEGLLEIDI